MTGIGISTNHKDLAEFHGSESLLISSAVLAPSMLSESFSCHTCLLSCLCNPGNHLNSSPANNSIVHLLQAASLVHVAISAPRSQNHWSHYLFASFFTLVVFQFQVSFPVNVILSWRVSLTCWTRMWHLTQLPLTLRKPTHKIYNLSDSSFSAERFKL